MLKSCKYCGRIHDAKFICPKKPKKNKESSEINQFRGSSLWKKKRKEIKQRDMFCRVCLLNESFDKDKFNSKDLQVHHIISLEEDFNKRLDNDNLITLCSRHHKEAEVGKISKIKLLELAKSKVIF